MDQALEMYRIRRGHQFTYVHWWKAVRYSPKWKTHISTEGAGTKRATIDQNESTERPQGCKAAKRARGKDKIPARTSDVQEQIETFIQAQSAAKVDMNDMKEFQQRLSAEKVEASRLAYMAAKENKEAKTIENKTKLIDKFTELLNADTTRMEPWAKEAHIRAVTRLGDQLFSKDGAE